MANKKIINATGVSIAGIDFKSKLEGSFYKILLENGIIPDHESRVFEFVPRLRPSIPFFNRIGKAFKLEMKPLQPITYTPDFTFEYNGMLIIIEAKGFENDVFYLKKNLFRRHLESLSQYSMYFEVRTQKELREVIKIIKMESPQIQKIRKLLPCLPEKDIPLGNKFLQERDWEELHNLVTSAIKRVEKATLKGSDKYADIDLASLYELASDVSNFTV